MVSKDFAIIGSTNGLSFIQFRVIIWTINSVPRIENRWYCACSSGLKKHYQSHKYIYKVVEFSPGANELTVWSLVTHIYAGEFGLYVVGFVHNLSPVGRRSITCTSVDLIEFQGIAVGKICSRSQRNQNTPFPYTKGHIKMFSAKCRPFCSVPSVLNAQYLPNHTHTVLQQGHPEGYWPIKGALNSNKHCRIWRCNYIEVVISAIAMFKQTICIWYVHLGVFPN